MLTLPCSLSSVQSNISLKSNCIYLSQYFTAKKKKIPPTELSVHHNRFTIETRFTDHRSPEQLIIKSLKHCKNYQNMIQRHEVNK